MQQQSNAGEVKSMPRRDEHSPYLKRLKRITDDIRHVSDEELDEIVATLRQAQLDMVEGIQPSTDAAHFRDQYFRLEMLRSMFRPL